MSNEITPSNPDYPFGGQEGIEDGAAPYLDLDPEMQASMMIPPRIPKNDGVFLYERGFEPDFAEVKQQQPQPQDSAGGLEPTPTPEGDSSSLERDDNLGKTTGAEKEAPVPSSFNVERPAGKALAPHETAENVHETALPSEVRAYVIEAAKGIETQALAEVDEQFGSGYPHYRGGQPDKALAYHNRHHSEAVRDGTVRMGEALALAPEALAVGRAAAAAHDIVQLKPRGVMEQESAQWLESEMRHRGHFTDAAVKAGSLAVLSTEPLFEQGQLVGQAVDRLEFPSLDAERIARSVACADFGELYVPSGPLLARDLYKEIRGIPPEGTPEIDEALISFQRAQVRLAEAYQYPHIQGERVFGALRPQVIAYHADTLEKLERGEIETWEQLIARDTTFMHQHS